MMQFNQTYSGKVYSLLNGMLYNWNAAGRMAESGDATYNMAKGVLLK